LDEVRSPLVADFRDLHLPHRYVGQLLEATNPTGYGNPDFNEVGVPFEDWMVANHPDQAQSVSFGNWTTIEEATTNGVLTAEYSAEWATYLEENGCAYDEGC
jgi:hypothetical protein